ncbi:MAG: thiopurine S-methyltransferase [Sideroxydans sp.]|nr:thiopurine S-methyltransferase [Sideroxydans sp.]
MKKDFWLERWEREEIGFHQDEVNPHLARHWPTLSPAAGSTVFVPLCGKSLDMVWLHNHGHPVVGVELSPVAVESFFAENGYTPTTRETRDFRQFEAGGIRILCGDFFDLTAGDLKDVDAVFDRASLVALPPEMRQRYSNHLMEILPSRTHILLITFEYDQAAMPGPPFSVSPEEVHALYREHAEIKLLEQVDILEATPRFKARGLDHLHENVFLLTRR